MTPKDSKANDGAKPNAGRKPEATLPMGRPGEKADPRRKCDGELDLDLGEIQTRLPYGSEDIADK